MSISSGKYWYSISTVYVYNNIIPYQLHTFGYTWIQTIGVIPTIPTCWKSNRIRIIIIFSVYVFPWRTRDGCMHKIAINVEWSYSEHGYKTVPLFVFGSVFGALIFWNAFIPVNTNAKYLNHTRLFHRNANTNNVVKAIQCILIHFFITLHQTVQFLIRIRF